MLGKVAFGVVLLGLIFATIGTATHEWSVVDGADATMGPWEFCTQGECQSVGHGTDCQKGDLIFPDMFNICRKLNSVRALSILGVIFGFFALVLAAKNAFSEPSPALALAFAALAFLAGLWSMVSFAVWDDMVALFTNNGQVPVSPGYSFAMQIVGWLCFWGAAAPGLLAGKAASTN